MEGSLGAERLHIRKVFVTGAIRIASPTDKVRMRGRHEIISLVCKAKGVEAFVPFLLDLEDQHPKELAACDLVIVEDTFKEPRLTVQLGSARTLKKPILHVYEETSDISRLRRQNEDVKWKIEYNRYPDLERLLGAWFDEYATCPVQAR